MIGNPLLLPDEGYNISRSVRLRSSASGNLSRTPSSASNRQRWTWSGWLKRGSLGSVAPVFGSNGNANTGIGFGFGFGGGDTFSYTINNVANYSTTASFRDPSAWYHVVVSFDSTQAVQADRLKLYVNSTQYLFTTNGVVLNSNYDINNTLATYHGWLQGFSTNYFDGYITEINFIDGQALTPSSFGETDAITGVWKPKKYAGTYGTNGFFLNFSDPSAATATTIGKDYSGNGNNWTPNNISVTSGSTYDSMLDVPTLWADGGNGRGNYATFDATSRARIAPVDGNLRWSGSSSSPGGAPFGLGRGVNFPMLSGKWYWEITPVAGSSQLIGIAAAASVFGVSSEEAGLDGTANSYFYLTGGGAWFGTTFTSGWGSSYTTSDVISIAYDADAGRLYFAKNNVWQASGNPSGGTNGVSIPASPQGQGWVPYVSSSTYTGNSYALNAGQRPFAYTPPTGFKALNTQNLPEPTIKKGGEYFNAVLYTGNGTSQSVTGVGFQPDFIWDKARSAAESHRLFDVIRGVGKPLYSNLTNAEGTELTGLLSFDSNGFSMGSGAPNTNAVTYVAWNWKANGAGVSNTSGSITSTVSVNTTAGFSVVTWAGNSTSGATIGHGLGVAPKLIITKSRTNPSSWVVGIGNISGFSVNDYLSLNSTNGKLSSSTFYQAYGASTFTVGVSAADEMNKTGNNYVAYCFSAVAGYSAFGSYTGNGSADGPFIYTGFLPRWVMVKKTSATDDWVVFDTARDTFNVVNDWLFPNLSNAELTTAGSPDVLSNGFKLRSNSGATNASGASFIFAAFAESPFKTALAR